MSDLLKYPIGKFENGKKYSKSDTNKHIKILAQFPPKLKALAAKLSDKELDTPYRDGGWTARQVVHHIADSHANMFIRVRFALTEDRPEIKGYAEDIWAELPDHKLPIKPSLQMIEGIHKRMVALFKTLDTKQLKRVYVHSQYKTEFSVQEVIALYAWHSEHHYQHIVNAIKFSK